MALRTLFFVALCLCALIGVNGHGYMLDPPPRASAAIPGNAAGSAGSCATGICFWFSQGCTIGCPHCGGSNDNGTYCGALPNGKTTPGSAQATETLPRHARTNLYAATKYPAGPAPCDPDECPMAARDECGFNPWCAPGAAPVFNPCGVAGGDIIEGKPGNGGDPPPGYKQGQDARLIPKLKTGSTTWRAGSVQNASWAIIANHGGGYQYRLCRNEGIVGQEVTEECFQRTPLEFVGDTQFIEYCTSTTQFPPYNPTPAKPFPKCGGPSDPPTTAITALDVSEGTLPKGSTWRRNPIPGCRSANAGAFGESCGPTNGTSPDDFQFPPAGPDLSRPGQLLGGFGAGGCYGAPYGRGCGQPGMPHPSRDLSKLWNHMFHFNVVDTLRVPDVPPGEYVLSFRWDCEQTPQIWSMCSDVTIV